MQSEDHVKVIGGMAAGGRQESPWTVPLIALASSLAVMCILYLDMIEAAVRTWWDMPAYSHCFLIIPLSIWLVWRDRETLGRLRPAPYPQGLLLGLPLIAISLAGSLTDVNEIRQFAMVGYIQVFVLAILGSQIYRRIIFPCLYLFFLIPTGEYLIPPLQDFTTRFVAMGLGLLGIPYHVVGNTLELANGRYEIAEACAGLRFLIATIAVGAFFAHLTFRKWSKILAFLLACAIVPVIANGFRALGIVLLAHWTDNRVAAGADHLIYGWGFSVLIGLALLFLGAEFADAPSPGKVDGPAVHREPKQQRFALVAIAAMAAAGAAPLGEYWLDAQSLRSGSATIETPQPSPGWLEAKMSDNWAPSFATPDAKREFSLSESSSHGAPVDVFIYYYAGGRDGPRLTSPANKMTNETMWHAVFSGRTTATVGRLPLELRELEIQSGSQMRLVWWAYWSNNRFTTSSLAVKLDKLQTTFSRDRGAALFAVSTGVDIDVDSARMRLRQALRALDGVPVRLITVFQGSQLKR